MRALMPILKLIISPVQTRSWLVDSLLAIPRILSGLLLTISFGSPKFGLPWSDPEKGLGLFEVAQWFQEDVAKFGIPFSFAPAFFAWLGAASEGIGGIFLALGLGTRVAAFFVTCTMLTAIFFQKWPNVIEYGSIWPALPAMSFLWVGMTCFAMGSGRIGIDYWLQKRP
jgi:putative oxidoreductase